MGMDFLNPCGIPEVVNSKIIDQIYIRTLRDLIGVGLLVSDEKRVFS